MGVADNWLSKLLSQKTSRKRCSGYRAPFSSFAFIIANPHPRRSAHFRLSRLHLGQTSLCSKGLTGVMLRWVEVMDEQGRTHRSRNCAIGR
jgi:hypothetical protein